MPFCPQCGQPLGATDKFCKGCGGKATTSSGSPVGGAAGSAPAAAGPGQPSSALRAGTGPSSNRGTDWLPSEFHRSGGKYGGSEAETEAVLGSMLAETNRVFGQLGVSVSAERRPAAKVAEVMCDECTRAIRNEVAVQAQGRTLHAACFTCSSCRGTIGSDSFVVRAGKPLCDGCVAKSKAGSQVASGQTGGGSAGAGASASGASPSAMGVPPFKPANTAGNSGSSLSSGGVSGAGGAKFGSTFGSGSNSSTSTLHGANTSSDAKPTGGAGSSGSGLTASQRNEFLSRRDAGKTLCAGCDTVMQGEGVTTASGAVYHSGCFLCMSCFRPIGADTAFAERDGQPFHPGCAPAAAGSASAATCATCHKSLSGKFVKANDGVTHHRDCFRCASCAGELSGGYALRDGRPHCASCVRSNPTPPTRTAAATVQPARDMVGIRYNHVTHEVTRVPASGAAGSAASSPPAAPSATAAAGGVFCKGCGSALGGNKFCPSCGAKACA